MSSGVRPPVHLPWEWPERLLSITGAAAAVALCAVTGWAFVRLPAAPDDSAVRWLRLVPSAFGIALFGILTALARVPHAYNYPWPITAENAARQYRLARRFALAFALLIAIIFLHVALGAAGGSRRQGGDVSVWPFSIDLLALALLVAAYSFLGWRRR